MLCLFFLIVGRKRCRFRYSGYRFYLQQEPASLCPIWSPYPAINLEISFTISLVVVGFSGGSIQQIPANHLLVKNCSALGIYLGGYLKNRPEVVQKVIVLQRSLASVLIHFVSYIPPSNSTRTSLRCFPSRMQTKPFR